MVLLFFALDLRTLSPPLLEEVKQCLLQLANLYAVSAPPVTRRNSDYVVEDRIGLCYLQRPVISPSNELKIVYSPRGRSFNLRDFHYAVKQLPSDSHLPPFLDDFGSSLFYDVDFSSILCDEALNSAGTKDIEKKIILISSYLVQNMNSKARKTLLDAADRCISMEFVFFEQKSSQLSDISENTNKFKEQICDLENCSFNAYLPDARVFNGLVKRWLRELTDNTEERLEALFVFQKSISGSSNQVSCKLCNPINQIMDRFGQCKSFCYDSIPQDNTDGSTFKENISYDVTKLHLEMDNIGMDSMKVGNHTFMVEESWRSWTNLQQVSSVVHFNVIERTNLASLNEGVVVGKPYILIPSVGQDVDAAPEEIYSSQSNDRFFHGLCRTLYLLNQGLICWSFCNIDTMKETAFYHYYILQPSDNGPMLLRRLAGAEEILPLPDVNSTDSSADEEIDNSIQLCLREVEVRDYNPVQHSGGIHEKINQLVQKSLQSGLVMSGATNPSSDSITYEKTAITTQCSNARNTKARQGESHSPHLINEAEKGVSHLTQEWEQLVVDNIPKIDPPPLEPKLEKPKSSPLASQRPMDTKTSKILERLGNPKHMKAKATSPTIVNYSALTSEGKTENHPSGHIDATDQGLVTSSQLMRPSFQRLKRKLR